MKSLTTIIRGILSIAALIIALFGAVITVTDVAISTIPDRILFFGITLFMGIIAITGFAFERLPLKQWLKLVLSSLLGIGVFLFLTVAFEPPFRWTYLVTGCYILFLSVLNLWFSFAKQQNPQTQTKWIALFLFLTMVQVTLGTFSNLIHALLILIVLLALMALVVTPYYMRKKMALLFAGSHEKLRRLLQPKIMFYDAFLEVYSYQYCGEIEKSQQLLKRIEEKISKTVKPSMVYQYMCHALIIENGFYSGETQGLAEHFEKMIQLNKQLYKDGYPMALTYRMVYLLDLYEDMAAFEIELERAIAFEKSYVFKKQSQAFHKHLELEHRLFDCAIMVKKGAFDQAQTLLNDLERQCIQPIHKHYVKQLMNPQHPTCLFGIDLIN